nr:MAG TPA: major tail protein [Caudoviricetes sp.]
MATIEALKKKYNRTTNVRKGLNALAFLAPMTVTVPEAITDAGGALKEIPTDFLPLGLITTDGITNSADANTEDVEALGYAEAVRTDLTKAPKTAHEVHGP